ncbi:MAG: Ig-like domain-containing protein, partial [Tannerella sp.]|nr:Ig-like domain-containing protein [Tannerella sp.]
MKKNFLWLYVAACLTGCDADTEEQKEVRVNGVMANTETLILEIGQTETLNAIVTPENATVKRYSWESANTNAVTVDNDGLVTAIGKGTTDVIVRTPRDGFTDTVKVTVIVRASGVTIDRPSMSVKVGSKGQLTATVLPAD